MTTEEQRIAIAEFCGFKVVDYKDTAGPIMCFKKEGNVAINKQLPDYPNDLNAMHEAEKELFKSGQTDTLNIAYWNVLWRVCGDSYCKLTTIAHATATQRAEALLRTIGKWKE